MNYDEFAFFNQQLAAMLREGIPLEGAIKQLSADLNHGPLRAEMELLERDLAGGLPLRDALPPRALPELYRRMLEIGARSNDLPGVLTLLADHYQRTNAIWNRLKGLMVYPLIVIVVSLGLTTVLSLVFRRFLWDFFDQFGIPRASSIAALWAPPLLLAATAALGVTAVLVPALRSRLRWRLPAFREASLAQLASSMVLMLRNAIPFPEALVLAESLESGLGKPAQWPGSLPPFPPLFLWLVQKGGEDLAGGFQKAADIYHARAAYRVELALYGILPVSVLLLGLMVFWQVLPLFRGMVWLMNTLGS